MVVLAVALGNMQRNGPSGDSLPERRISSSMVPGGMDSTVEMETSRWIRGMAVLKRAAGFAFFFLVTFWRGVSACFAAAAAYDGALRQLSLFPPGREL